MNDVRQEHDSLLIGDLVLDVGQRRVSRNGVQLEMPGLSFRMLHALALAAPGMLSHDDLIQRVWPGRVISPETLTQRVKLVRQAIGDDARNPRYIGLVRGAGYRMLVPVQRMSGARRRPALRFVDEVLQRNIPAVTIVYAVAAWAVSLGLRPLNDVLPGLPGWTMPAFSVLLIVGLPMTVLLAWRMAGARRIATQWQSSTEGRLSAAAMLLAVVAVTAGLAFAIFPDADTAANDIAVLPFENASGDTAGEVLSEGVSVGLRDQLGQIPDLRVVARASSVFFRDAEIGAAEVASQLAVDKLITGVVRMLEDTVIINVEIVDGRTGTQLWSETYEAQQDRILIAQEQLHADVIAQIAPTAHSGERVSSLPTSSEAANSLMMIADRYYQDVLDRPVLDAELLAEATDTYWLAVTEDPQSALLRARLAAALLYGGNDADAATQIEAALRLDPNVSRVQHIQGLLMLARHADGVGEHFRRAVELDANNVEALNDYGLYLWANNDVNSARRLLERARELDHFSIGRYQVLGNFYGTAGFFEEAFDLAETVPRRSDPAAADLFVSQIHELAGQLDFAIAWAMSAYERNPDFDDARWKLAELYARIGDLESAAQFDPVPSVSTLYFSRDYEAMIDRAAENMFEDRSPLWVFAIAQAYIATDRFETVISVLSKYGLPEILTRDGATTSEIEAAILLADALKQSGLRDEAVRIADLLHDRFVMWRDQHRQSWHAYINLACIHSIRGEKEMALRALETMMEQRGLPWYPRVRDQACFRITLRDEPRYAAVLEELAGRRTALRAALPQTLAQFHAGQRP